MTEQCWVRPITPYRKTPLTVLICDAKGRRTSHTIEVVIICNIRSLETLDLNFHVPVVAMVLPTFKPEQLEIGTVGPTIDHDT